MALLRVLMSRSNGFSLRSYWGSLGGVERSVETEEEVSKDAWQRSRTVDRVMRLLALQVSSHLHAFFGNDSQHTPNDDKLIEGSADKQL